jgi:DegV family protein with EDD domain
MSRIRIITDSASDLPVADEQRLGISVVPLSIRFGDEEFVDRKDLTPQEFWARCKSSPTLPETAAPSPGAFQASYEQAKADGYDGAVVLCLSALLSATHQSAVLAAQAVSDFDVRVIDTKAVSMAQGLLVIDVAEYAANGASLDDVVSYAQDLVPRVGVCAMLDTLEHLIKGGRVGGAKALLGQVLSIKPLLELKDGVVAEVGRARTKNKALVAISEEAAKHAPLRRLALVHGASPDIEALSALVSSLATEFPLIVTDIGPVVGTHGGPGIIGLCWVQA